MTWSGRRARNDRERPAAVAAFRTRSRFRSAHPHRDRRLGRSLALPRASPSQDRYRPFTLADEAIARPIPGGHNDGLSIRTHLLPK